MDIGMPVMNGIVATQQLKTKLPDIPVLALSAWFQEQQVVEMLAAGANGYCLKSIDWQQLLAVIRFNSEWRYLLRSKSRTETSLSLEINDITH